MVEASTLLAHSQNVLSSGNLCAGTTGARNAVATGYNTRKPGEGHGSRGSLSLAFTSLQRTRVALRQLFSCRHQPADEILGCDRLIYVSFTAGFQILVTMPLLIVSFCFTLLAGPGAEIQGQSHRGHDMVELSSSVSRPGHDN